LFLLRRFGEHDLIRWRPLQFRRRKLWHGLCFPDFSKGFQSHMPL
jgi:hypothetical protein